MLESISYEEAQKILLGAVRPKQDIEWIPLADTIGRVLARNAEASLDQPPFPRSPLDGYAIRGEDTAGASFEHPASLRVVGKVYAGYVYEGEIGPGQALRIMTGAPIPRGANAVIRQEETNMADVGEEVLLYQEVKPWQNYCRQGEDYQRGDILLKEGCVIGSGEAAILSSLGMAEVPVWRRPSVSIFSSGDEVMQPGQPLLPGKIYDSNLIYIRSRMKEFGIPVAASCHVADQPQLMARYIRGAASTSDLIITTGGVSVGEKDIMHEVMEILEGEPLFWRVKLKPGMPTLAFIYRKIPVICLSGNPFGAIANLELLVRPLLAELSHDPGLRLQKQQAIVQNGCAKPAGVTRFLRGHLEAGRVSISGKKQTSGAIATMAGCNCFVEVPAMQKGVEEGSLVWVYPLAVRSAGQ